MKIIFSIVSMSCSKAITDFYMQNGIIFNFQCIGHGTAPTEMMEMLGLGSSEKEIIISIGQSNTVENALENLRDSIDSFKKSGIVMSIPISAINNIVAQITSANNSKISQKSEETQMQTKSSNSLIFISVNQGYTDEVMNTARKAGASGGTIIRARWTGADSPEQFFGITLQAEKEIIVILAANETRNNIMESVNAEHGIKTEAQAVIWSVAVDKAFKIS